MVNLQTTQIRGRMMDLVEEQELEIGTRQDGDQSVVDKLVIDY